MSSPEINRIAETIARAEKVLIAAHEKPDADAIGSMFALAEFLRSNNHPAEVYLKEPPGAQFQLFCSPGDYTLEIPPGCDVTVLLDTPNCKRAALPEAVPVHVVMDHHIDNSFSDESVIRYLDATAAATADLVFLLIRSMPDWQFNARCATLLMLGIVGDTGAFRFDNTRPETLQDASELLAAGAEYRKIIHALFFNVPVNQQMFEAELIANHFHLYDHGRVLCAAAEKSLIEKHQLNLKDAEGIVDRLRATAGVVLTALITYRGENQYKCSLRSCSQELSAGKIARELGGGGHELAAGCTLNVENAEQAEAVLMAAVRRYL